MIESAKKDFPLKESEVNDISSGLFNSFLGIGQILGPLYGSYMMAETGNFKLTCDIAGFLCLFLAVIYFLCADGAGAISRSSCKGGSPKDLEESLVYEKRRRLLSDMVARSPAIRSPYIDRNVFSGFQSSVKRNKRKLSNSHLA